MTAEEARGFIQEHLSFIAEPLSRRLSISGIRYLALAGAALLARAGAPPVRNAPLQAR